MSTAAFNPEQISSFGNTTQQVLSPVRWRSLTLVLLALVGSLAFNLPAIAQDSAAPEPSANQPGDDETESQQAGEAAGEESAEAEAGGIDKYIDDKFGPVADAWEGLVLTSIPIGSKYGDVTTLTSEEVVKKVGLNAGQVAEIENLMAEWNQKKAATTNGFERADLQETYRESILAVLDETQKQNFKEARTAPIVLLLLVLGAAFFTVVFGFINVRLIPFAIKVVSGKYDNVEKQGAKSVKPEVNEVDGDLVDTIRDEGESGEVSHFQALATAVSGTVGLGNIAGVAVAIAMGGPGATFWMIICGLLGMSTKFVECTLGVKYRDVDRDGTVHGGPMYYLQRGMGELGVGWLGTGLAVIFAVLCVGASLGGGNMFQANQAADQIKTMMGLEGTADGVIIGVIMAVLVAIVIIGGIKRIATVTEKIVPLMAVIYVAAALVIILANITRVPEAFGQIIAGAFTPAAGFGGMVGVIMVGFQRAAFSNEAGAGSAAIAHSAVKTRYPASEGVVALLEPFIDTVVICTMTALVIVLFNADGAFQYADVVKNQVEINGERIGGAPLTSAAFDTVLPGFRYVLTVAIVLFAFSTMISWSYYGLQSWKYLFGRSRGADLTYKIMFCLAVIVGAAISLDAVIKFSDAMILALVFPNMLGLLILFPKVKQELTRYLSATDQVDQES